MKIWLIINSRCEAQPDPLTWTRKLLKKKRNLSGWHTFDLQREMRVAELDKSCWVHSTSTSTSVAADMLKKLFHVLALFAVLSLAYYVMLLFYSNDSTFFIKPYYVVNGNNTLSWVIKERVKELWEMKTKAPNASQEKSQTQAPTNKTLGPCRDTPPTLVGPLHVEFDSKRTLDEVRNVVSSNLQEGGRYKPPDCVSRQKVGGWTETNE